jgi:hypothetical protein
MAKIAKKLTDTEIKSTKPADKEINLFDGDGLILRIAPLAKGGRKLVFQVCSASEQEKNQNEPWDLSSPYTGKSQSLTR